MDSIKLQNKYSLTKLNRILYEIEKTQVLTDNNQFQLVEQIRNLSEFLVYAEKYQKNYFELFIEVNVMEHFIKFLYQGNRLINIQLIQTMSILIQNIEEKMKIYYIFAHPFMNDLILYDFDFGKDEELVDYYVSFLKSLTLKLNIETVNFFFNDKFKTFPLYHQAVKFYNHKEPMVRTSVRTITLTIYNIQNPKMRDLFLGLPYCSYFANLACYLRDFWVQIDKHVVSLASESRQIDLMMNDAEDANETLFYIQDIFSAGDADLNKMLTNCLLHYAYLPTVVKSLCVLKHKPQLSLNTCLYVLTQTFRIIKNQEFSNLLFAALFMPYLPAKFISSMENLPKNPATYSSKFKNNHLNTYTLVQYVQEYYNMSNIEVFINHGHHNFEFLQEIKLEYENTINSQLQADDDPNMDFKPPNEAELRNKVRDLFLSKVTEANVQQIQEEHERLSEGLGLKIGLVLDQYQNKPQDDEVLAAGSFGQLNINNEDSSSSLVENFEIMKQAIDHSELKQFQKSPNKEIILSFLRSKDDNLLLLIGGLLMSVQYNSYIIPKFIQQVPEVCPARSYVDLQLIEPIGEEQAPQEIQNENQVQVQQEAEELKQDDPNLIKIKSGVFTELQQQQKQSLVNLILDKLESDPPFRNFTLRLYAKLLIDLHPPQEYPLSADQMKLLVSAYKNKIYHIKRIVYQLDSKNVLDPYFNFFDAFLAEIQKFKHIDSYVEFNRHLAQPLLMLPFITEELQQRISEQLRLPKLEDDVTNMTNYITNFLLLRQIVLYYKSCGEITDLDRNEIELEQSEVKEWSEGEEILPIPPQRRYQNCFLRSSLKNNSLEQMFLMGDDNYFVLLKPNFTNPAHIKARVQYICKYKVIVDNLVEKHEPRNLFIAMISNENADAFTEMVLYFEDRRKCQETKEYIDFKRKEQLDNEKARIEKFLVTVCEAELQDIVATAAATTATTAEQL